MRTYNLGMIGIKVTKHGFILLTEAMAAPTPVSALLHAATIMVSGIFFILRLTTVVH